MIVLLVSGAFGFFLIRVNSYLTEYILATIESDSGNAVHIDTKPIMKDLKEELHKKDFQFYIQLYLAILIFGLTVAFISIRFSHRVAGPIYRIKTVLDRATLGDFSPRITLRKKDQLKDLAQKLNTLLDTLEKEK